MLYSEDYLGPRWTYGLTYRPLGIGTAPHDYLVLSQRTHPAFAFGTIDYPFPLSDAQAAAFELTYVDPDLAVGLLANAKAIYGDDTLTVHVWNDPRSGGIHAAILAHDDAEQQPFVVERTDTARLSRDEALSRLHTLVRDQVQACEVRKNLQNWWFRHRERTVAS